ncbi:uncharacterized protein LOC128680581 [Plodia interpunctella]|uniref:uncharacterized protein LOC128670920 n=1 Tax=Plodia interpunctella TaxID=58824 RepID=UPI00236773AF|nr:uncharacterized protein LOC128670920 [Plodia interpunctella]XP_053619795.1 uncharacterized protein LOC128680581 [Plodia interpunctella]
MQSTSKSGGPENCAGCKKSLLKKEHLRCIACKAAYDILCLNISSERYRSFYSANSERKNNWKCPECLSKIPKQGNLNTPVRANPPSSISTEDVLDIESPIDNENVTLRSRSTKTTVNESLLLYDLKDETESSPNSSNYVKVFAEEMRAMRQELSRMCDKITSFTDAINTRMDRLEQRVTVIENRKSELESCKIQELESTVSQLQRELQDREQEALGSDIEIASLPEVKNENSIHVILTVAKKLGVDLEERDVVHAQRMGPAAAAPAPGGEEAAERARPRPLVARLARRATRDALLRAVRVRRGVTTEGMNLQERAPFRSFFVNERLTKRNRQLFQRVREAAKRMHWKFVWTREGKVYARKEQGKASVRLRCDKDIIEVFGDCTVGPT